GNRENDQIDVSERCALVITEVPTAIDVPDAAASQDNRQIFIGVQVAVRDARALDDHGVIEHRAVAIASRPQFIQVISEYPDMIRIQLNDLGDLPGVTPMM